MGWGKLTGKLMPRLYSPSVVGFYEQLWAANGARHLRDLVLHGYYGVLPPGDSYADDLPIRFIRSAEMNSDLDVDLGDCPFVEEQYYIKKAQVQKDDVLLAVKGATIASRKCVAHVREDIGEAIVNGSIYRMQVKPEVNPRFLAIVLSTEMLKRQMRLALTANNGVDYLDKSLIHHLVVPAPERTVQDKLVAIYDTAMAASISAKAEAATLLASIDDYLLSELGITLPPETEDTLANRTFRVSAHELGGSRFDALFHKPYLAALIEALENSRYRAVRLGKISPSLAGGATPTRGDAELYANEGVKFLRIMNVRENRIVLEDMKYVQDHVHARELRRSQLTAGDVLMTITGRVGTCAVVQPEILPANINQHIVRLRMNPALALPEYVAFFFNSEFGTALSNRGVTGGTRIALDYGSIRGLQVPLPDIKHQARIVEEAQRIQDASRSLEAQADTELETAKREIEAILLGGAT